MMQQSMRLRALRDINAQPRDSVRVWGQCRQFVKTFCMRNVE